jgi:xylan 1,4-beta-xylosidase
MPISRRIVMTGALAAPLAPAVGSACGQVASWGQGAENQRKADLGNGYFQNPIVAGDHPDPTILKDGDDYYMTFSSFNSYPGLVIWHSTDLINWAPITAALRKHLGTIWAVDLVRHEGRYFIYIPADPQGQGWSIFAIWADDIRGPWSDPVDLGIRGCIDPGHVVGEDDRRYLFTNGIRKIRLKDNGLETDGALEPAYAPWIYPDDWVVENFAPEGPKLLRRNGWFYLITAVGGTAGPVTGHMVIAARSRSVHGPWEHCPANPLVRTRSRAEPWWSRGHASLVEGPGGDWWMVYHGYENGFHTLGRQTLMEPIAWTEDGWFRALGGDLSQPIRAPRGGRPGPSAPGLSDDFYTNRFGTHWSFDTSAPDEARRARHGGNALVIAASGTTPASSPPLTVTPADRSYEAEISLELRGNSEAGLLLYYNPKAYVGLGFTPTALKIHQYSQELEWARIPIQTRRLRLRITNDENVITYHYSTDDGQSWVRHGTRMEVSGMHHNVFGGFVSLRIGVYVVGEGSATLRDFRYRANPPRKPETALPSGAGTR